MSAMLSHDYSDEVSFGKMTKGKQCQQGRVGTIGKNRESGLSSRQ